MKARYLSILLLFVAISLNAQSKKIIASCCDAKEARCTGSDNCTACSNCSSCKHCSNGGTCGVCTGSSKGRSYNYSNRVSTNKKSNGYRDSERNSNNKYYSKVGKTVYVKSKSLNLRETPNTNSSILEELKLNDQLIILEEKTGWIKVKNPKNDNIGFVKSEYIKF